MKLILIALLALTLSSFAEDKTTVRCKYFAATQLEAEIGAVSMGKFINPTAEQESLTSELFTDEKGQTYWVATFVIKITRGELRGVLPESAKKPRYD